MVRWYDCLAAVLMADLMISLFWAAIVADPIWVSIVVGVALSLLWDLWAQVYCVIRRNQENRKR